MAASRVIGTGVIVVTANTAPAQAAVAAVGTAGQKAASSIAQNFTNAAKALNSSPLISNAETISALFIQMGGNVSRAASLVTSLIRPVSVLATAFGPLTVGVGGTVLQLGLFAAAGVAAANTAKGLADDAAAAAGRLADLGLTVGPEASGDLAIYAQGAQDLSIAMDRLSVALGSGVAGEIGVMSEALSTSIPDIAAYASGINAIGDALVTRFLPPLALARDLIRYGESSLYHALTDSARAAVENAAATSQMQKEYELLGMTVDESNVYQDRQVQLAKEAAQAERDAAAAARERAAAQREADKMSAEDSARARAEVLAQLNADDKAFLVEIQHEQDLATAIRETNEEWDAQAQAAREGAAATEAAAADALAAADRLLEQFRNAQIAAAALLATSWTTTFESIAQSAVAHYQMQIDAGKQLTVQEAERANTALAAAEVFSIAQAGIAAALAGIQTFATLSAIMTPLGAAAVATATSVAAYAAAVYAIEAHQPFKFSGVDWHHGKDPNYDPDADHAPTSTPDNPRADKPDVPSGARSSGGSGGRMTAEIRILPPQRANKRPRRGR